MIRMMNKTLTQGQENAVKGIPDYMGSDGLLICGKCHTPKQIRITERTEYCMCRCESEAYKAEREAFRRMQRTIEIDRIRSTGIQDQKILSFTFSNDDGKNPEISNFARQYAEHFETARENNHGLLLYGETGTGKSFFAGCIANALIDRGYSVFATNIIRLQNQLFHAEDKNSILGEISRYDLLLLDDLGAERNTSFSIEQVYSIIDERYKANKPLIATTNYSPQYLQSLQDVEHRRIYDRIAEMCTAVRVEGVRRKQAGHEKTRQLLDAMNGNCPELPLNP